MATEVGIRLGARVTGSIVGQRRPTVNVNRVVAPIGGLL